MGVKDKMKIRKFTEEEIFKIIDEFDFDEAREDYRPNMNLPKLIKSKLKDKFRTPQGFRRAIERDGLVGTDFKKALNNQKSNGSKR